MTIADEVTIPPLSRSDASCDLVWAWLRRLVDHPDDNVIVTPETRTITGQLVPGWKISGVDVPSTVRTLWPHESAENQTRVAGKIRQRLKDRTLVLNVVPGRARVADAVQWVRDDGPSTALYTPERDVAVAGDGTPLDDNDGEDDRRTGTLTMLRSTPLSSADVVASARQSFDDMIKGLEAETATYQDAIKAALTMLATAVNAIVIYPESDELVIVESEPETGQQE